MTKQRRNNWTQMRADELGFHIESEFHEGESSSNRNTGEKSNDAQIINTGDRNREILQSRIQSNDVLFVNTSDHPSMLLTMDMFDGKNYLAWCRAIRRVLGARNKLDFIEGTMAEPDVNSVDRKQWIKVDYLVSTWIMNSMTKELSRGLQHIESSKELWTELRRRFSRTNGPKIYKLRREIATYMQGNQTVTMYFHNLQTLWDELQLLIANKPCTCRLCRCGSTEHNNQNDETQKMMQFLMGLNEAFEGIRNQILILDPLPDVSKAYSMVLNVEDQKVVSNIYGELNEQSAMHFGQKNVNYRYDGFKRKLSREEKLKLKCLHCRGIGHEKAECFELIGVPDWYKKFKGEKGKNRVNHVDDEAENVSEQDLNMRAIDDYKSDMQRMIQTEISKAMNLLIVNQKKVEAISNQVNAVRTSEEHINADSEHYMGHYAFTVTTEINKEEWIVDSGASTHMCCNPKLMLSLRHLDQAQRIFLPDGSVLTTNLMGEARINDDIVLTRVLFAPAFTHNLISVGQMIKDIAGRVLFLPTHCLIQNQVNDHVLGIGKLKGKLYVFKHTVTEAVYLSIHDEDLSLRSWHEVMGHPSTTTMRHMPQLQRRFSAADFDQLASCEICHFAKQPRNGFPVLQRRSDSLFHLIHADVWGPYHVESVSNTPYILTLVEDHSRTTWTYLLSSKSQVWKILRTFFIMVRVQFKTNVQVLCTDNGTEFLNSSMKELLQELGIIHQRSCIHSPQQNGISRAKAQTLASSCKSSNVSK